MDQEIKILALDVATHTGWCHAKDHGVWDLSLKRDMDSAFRLLAFRNKLGEIAVEMDGIDMIVFERTAGRYKAALVTQSELHGTLKLWAKDNSVPFRAYSAAEIKKFATGKGNCGKPAMIQAAKEKYGYQGNNDNIADAMHLYALARSDYQQLS